MNAEGVRVWVWLCLVGDADLVVSDWKWLFIEIYGESNFRARRVVWWMSLGRIYGSSIHVYIFIFVDEIENWNR